MLCAIDFGFESTSTLFTFVLEPTGVERGVILQVQLRVEGSLTVATFMWSRTSVKSETYRLDLYRMKFTLFVKRVKVCLDQASAMRLRLVLLHQASTLR